MRDLKYNNKAPALREGGTKGNLKYNNKALALREGDQGEPKIE